MVLTFAKLYDSLKAMEQSHHLLSSGEDSRSMEAIRNGLNLRKKDCGSFWDDFISVCGNADALAELLEIPKEKITGWPGKIKENLDKIQKLDNKSNEKDAVMSTGDMPNPINATSEV